MEVLFAVMTIFQNMGGKRLFLRLFSYFVARLEPILATTFIVNAILISDLINAHMVFLGHRMSSPLALFFLPFSVLLTIATLMAAIVLVDYIASLKNLSLMDRLEAFRDKLMSE